MEKLIKNYLAAFDELNTLVSFRFRSMNKDDKKRTETIIDDLLSFLILAYENGIQDVSQMLKENIQPDIQQMYSTIYLEIDGKNFSDRAIEHIESNDESALIELVQDEYHRVYESAKANGATSAKKKNASKTWKTVGDDKVRDTHAYLDGITVPIAEKFYTYDGDSALYPGNFEKAENNCGCRCIAVYS
ncbi:MAG: hypothetical protein J6S85_13835 [Methanobrevibacter sp.]|nr:hypothetical protein [Methanobrevibacter sp.]